MKTKDSTAVRTFLFCLTSILGFAGVQACAGHGRTENPRSVKMAQAAAHDLLALVRTQKSGPLEQQGSYLDSSPRYLLFQIFTGAPNPQTGVFHAFRNKGEYERIVRTIKRAINPQSVRTDRRLGFSVGPLALDMTAAETRRIIRDSFTVALDNDMAVSFHLDDYMFWKNATDANGRRLIDDPTNKEWKDWQGTTSDPLKIGWLVNIPLAPQMCYESAKIKSAVRAAATVIGEEVKAGVDNLRTAGREDLFAGVVVGWESNLADGYASLTLKGFTARRPPENFDLEREQILHDHIETWSKGIYDTGISKDKIYTHVAIIPKRHYEGWKRLPIEEFRRIPQATAVRAPWVAFNDYSNPGFSLYPDEGLLQDIHNVIKEKGNRPWALSEGTNVTPEEARRGLGVGARMTWETFLAQFFNYGAMVVNIFGGWQGEAGVWGQTTESEEAIAAYRKFLRGNPLIESEIPAALGSPSGRDSDTDLPTRLDSLRQKIERYRDRGGDMRTIEKELMLLDTYLRKGDLQNATTVLDRIEPLLR